MSVVLAVCVIAATALIALMLVGIKTGILTQSDVEASDTSIVSSSILEAKERAAEEAEKAKKEAEAKATAERKAKEEADAKAAEQAKKEAAEKALVTAHPEMKASITLQLPSGDDLKIDRSTVQSWETKNADGSWTKDETAWNQHIADFVAKMAADVDTIGKPHTFNATGIGPIEVDGNEYYGWQVDQAAEVAQLTSELDEGKTVTREPNYSSREEAKENDNGGIGQSYCEIDASRQHLWIYKDGQLQFETDVVTGLMDESHYTPEGVYLLLDKEKDATLKGEQLPDGTRSYETPVSYWMPITHTGIGLHDAWWKSVFGEGQNEWNGSHGCVNLPADVAETVYNDLTMDTPIVIYYSQPYELREAPPSAVDQYLAAQKAAAEAAQAAADQDAQDQDDEEETETEETPAATPAPTTAPTPAPTTAPTPAPTQAAAAADTAPAAQADGADTSAQ